MPTFHVEQPLCTGGLATFGGADAHHLRDVLRVRRGDPLTVCAAGAYWQGVVEAVHRTTVAVRAVAPAPAPWQPRTSIHLYQAMPKGRGFETVIQYASELGVATLTPLITERTIGRRVECDDRQRMRWEAVAAAAQRQCGRPLPLEVGSPVTLADALPLLSGALVAVPGAPPIEPRTVGPEVRVVIGPEGGLSPEEQTRLTERDTRLFGILAYTLRAATATAAVLAVVNQEIARSDVVSASDRETADR